MKKILNQAVWVLFLTGILLGVPRLAGLFADLFDYAQLDPDGAFAWISVHHIFQAVVFLVIMVLISKMSNLRFGFGWGDREVGLYYVRLFTVIFGVYTLVSLVIVLAVGSFQVFPYPLSPVNIVGQLGFQLFLSGPSEELIFRAFAITMLAMLLRGGICNGRLSTANIIAAIIFGLAHIRFTLVPFSLYCNPFQVVYAIGLGLVYGLCYEQSKSILYPMLMHSISNVVAVGVSIIAGIVIG